MDYGVEVPSYRRVDSKKQTKKLDFENGLIGLLVVLASGVMISRVGFGFVEGLYLAPFGIGYFLSMVKKSDFKKLLLVYLAVNVGYLIGYSKGKDIIIYVSISTAILLCKIICNTLNKEFKNSIAFLAIVGVTLAVGLFIGEQSFEINLIFVLFFALKDILHSLMHAFPLCIPSKIHITFSESHLRILHQHIFCLHYKCYPLQHNCNTDQQLPRPRFLFLLFFLLLGSSTILIYSVNFLWKQLFLISRPVNI